MKAKVKRTATLLITCPDRKGIVASVADFLFKHNANILHSDQHQDAEDGLFLMRVEWDLDGFGVVPENFGNAFASVATPFNMAWKVLSTDVVPRMAIFVSKQDHCLTDLLYRHRAEELRCEIPLIIGNHPEVEDIARFHGVPFHYVPLDPHAESGAPGSKEAAERKQLDLLQEHNIDLVVLARYMQILSPNFVSHFPTRIINIHHSFLPAFIGSKPYHRAYERGVKLIGATSHYVTATLDDGPIIEQDVTRISHRDDVADLIQKGRDLERVVLSRAVRWHLDGRIVTYKNRTVVFE